jgi:hypothetical protein
MTRFRITGMMREEGIAPGAWDWPRVRDCLVARCGEIALRWSLTAQRLRRVGGGAVVLLRVAPDDPNIEAWGELYIRAEPLAQALSEALETEVVVVSGTVDDSSGSFARYDRGAPIEVETRVGHALTLAARVVGVDAELLREAVVDARSRDEEPPPEVAAEEEDPELDGEEFAEQAWLEHKRREAQAWMARYRQLKSTRSGGNENTQV